MEKDNQFQTPQQLIQRLEKTDLPLEEREEALLTLTKNYTVQQNPKGVIDLIQYSYKLAPETSKMYIAKI